MPTRLAASIARWLFPCAFIAAMCSDFACGEDANPPQVTVESWVVEVSLAEKSRDVGGRSLGDLFSIGTAKLNSLAELGLTVNQLVDELKSKKLGHVLANSKLRLPSGQQGSLQVNGTTIGATATVNGEKIRLDYRVAITEEDPKLRDTVTGVPGYRQWMADSGFELESGKAAMLSSLLPVPGKLPKGMAVIVQATFEKLPKTPDSGIVTTTAPISAKPSIIEVATDSRPANGSAAGPDLKPLTIHLTVIEVNSDKLKRLGFEWTQLSAENPKQFAVEGIAPLKNGQQMSADQLNGFLKSLYQNGLARVIAEPTLVTLDGRPAIFNSGTTSVEFVPSLADNGRVKLSCRLKTGDSSVIKADDELDVGKLCLVRNANIRRPGQSPGTETLVLARVDLVKSGYLPTISGTPTYIEVAGKSK